DGSTWAFGPESGDAATTVSGDALDLCRVAGQRASAAETGLQASGPDGEAVLELVRTFARSFWPPDPGAGPSIPRPERSTREDQADGGGRGAGGDHAEGVAGGGGVAGALDGVDAGGGEGGVGAAQAGAQHHPQVVGDGVAQRQAGDHAEDQ